jgi:hypothetical protein
MLIELVGPAEARLIGRCRSFSPFLGTRSHVDSHPSVVAQLEAVG